MIKIYGLDTRNNLGGSNSSDVIAASQKSVKDYVDGAVANGYKVLNTNATVSSNAVNVSTVFGGNTYHESCIQISNANDTTVTLNTLATYKNQFVLINTNTSTTRNFVFNLSSLEYTSVNCMSDCVTSATQLTFEVLARSARVVEFEKIGNVLNVNVSDIVMATTARN